MELHCLRHGLTTENVEGIFPGLSGGELLEVQREELSRVRFDASAYDAVYCSPALRCRQTAQCLGIPHWKTEARIAERSFGIFGGLTRAECEDRFPDAFRQFRKFDAGYQVPSGESRAQHLARITGWLREAEAYQRVLAITHGGTIDFLYRMGRGIDLHGGTEIFSSSNVSLSTFSVRWPRVELVSYDIRLVT